ncbi:unnamed protein product [Closterium sp. Yama58-4]|nr:unnamed protein product [Closterium sp. Yama58-4]
MPVFETHAGDPGIRLFGRTIEATTSQSDSPRASVSGESRRTNNGREDDTAETAGSSAVNSAASQQQCRGLDAILAAAMEGQAATGKPKQARVPSCSSMKSQVDDEPRAGNGATEGEDNAGSRKHSTISQAKQAEQEVRNNGASAGDQHSDSDGAGDSGVDEPTEQAQLAQAQAQLAQPTTGAQEQAASERADGQEQQQQPELEQQEQQSLKRPTKKLPCPRCASMDTKFCYYNNYNASQPRHFCKGCQRYWTAGGTLRNVPVGSGRRKGKIPAGAAAAAAAPAALSPGAQQPAAGLPPAGGAVAGPFGFCPSAGRSCSPDGSSVTGLTGLTGLTNGMVSPGAEVLSMSSPAAAAAAAAAAMAAASAAAAVAGSSRWGMDPAVVATDAASNPFAAALPNGQFVPSNLPTHLPAHLPAHLPPHMAVDSTAAIRQMGLPSAFSTPTGATFASPPAAPGAQAPGGMAGNPAGLAALYPWRFGGVPFAAGQAPAEAPLSLPGLPNLSAPSAFGGLARGSPSAFCPSTTAAPSSAPGASATVSATPSAHAPFPVSAPVPSAWSPYMGAYPPAFAPLHPMSAQHPPGAPPFAPAFNVPAFPPGAIAPWSSAGFAHPPLPHPSQLPPHPPMDLSRPSELYFPASAQLSGKRGREAEGNASGADGAVDFLNKRQREC